MSTERTRIDASYIIAYNGTNHVILQNGVVIFEGNEVIHVGKSYSGQVDQKIDASGKLVIPGFVNLHTHICTSPLTKSLREDLPRHVKASFTGTITTKPRKKLPNESETLAKSSLVELLKSGVTTLVEMGAPDHMGYDESVKLLGDVGIRTYVSAGYRSATWAGDSIGGEYVHDEEEGLRQMENALHYLRKHEGSYEGRLRFILYPRCVDLVSPALFEETKNLSNELGLPIETHTSQGVGEYQAMKKQYGKTPVEFLYDLGLLNSKMILGHCVYISSHHLIGDTQNGAELELIAKNGATVAHCPWVFAKRGVALESYPQYLQHGINVGLGTDISPQDMLVEMRLAATIAKIIEDKSAVATAADLFNSATLVGAQALGREDLGRISPGAKADLVLINLKTLRIAPVRDPIKNLVYGATHEDVETVIIDGRIVVDQEQVAGMDETKIANELQKIGENLWADIPRRDDEGRTVNEISPLSFPAWES